MVIMKDRNQSIKALTKRKLYHCGCFGFSSAHEFEEAYLINDDVVD